jgi:LysR family transcriptional regulator, cyn operon transcriptional activator
MNLELYRAFYNIAKFGSISRASEQLYITQPAVSRALQQLESQLKCQLFFRTPKGAVLTPEGEILFIHIEQAFTQISIGEKSIKDVQNLLIGDIKIGISDTLCKYYLLPYLKLFNNLHPSIKIHVICLTSKAIIEHIKLGKIDFGIINMPYSDDQLKYKTIIEVQDCFVVGEKYKRLSYQIQPLQEIIKYPLVLLEKSSNTRDYIDRYFSNYSLNVVPDFELGNIDLLIHFAKNDFGIACVIKNFIHDDLEKGNLYEVSIIEKIPKREVRAVWLKNVPLSTASKELINNLDYLEPYDI